MTMGAGKFEICRAGRKAGNSPTSWCSIQFSGQQSGNSVRISMFQSWGIIPPSGNLVFSVKAFNWLDEAHPQYGG